MPPSETWKVLELFQHFFPTIPSTPLHLVDLCCLWRRQINLVETQQIIISLTMWGLQLQLSYQMWPHCLSKLIYLLIPVMQLFICQIYFCHSYKERPPETLLSDDKFRPPETLLSDDKFRNKHLLPYFRNTSTLKVIEKKSRKPKAGFLKR